MAGRCCALMLVWLVLLDAASGAEPGEYVIEPPDVLRIVADELPARGELIDAERVVGPDGSVSLGAYGSAMVAGLTLDQAKAAIAKKLSSHAQPDCRLRLRVEVVSSISKVFYVIAPGTDGDRVFRLLVDGRATVASAVLEFEGLAAMATEEGVWVSRHSGKVLEVDWRAITGAGRLASNHRLEPGDRVFVGRFPGK